MPGFDGINIEIVELYGIILIIINVLHVCLHYSKCPVINIAVVILTRIDEYKKTIHLKTFLQVKLQSITTNCVFLLH